MKLDIHNQQSQPPSAAPQDPVRNPPQWHILDVGSIWMKEFASAMAGCANITAWSPCMLATGTLQGWVRPRALEHPPLQINDFPLQRGYARAPLRWLRPYQYRLRRQLLARTTHPAATPLVCSTPFYAPLAELWPGPVVYYSTDLTMAYHGLDPRQVLSLERRLCRVATLVCPNSRRIADHLITQAGCDPHKIAIVPNATRRSNLSEAPRIQPGPLPTDVRDLPRPIAGVLGDLSGNMDWELIADSIRLTPGFSWLFVGPSHRPIPGSDAKAVAQRTAMQWVKQNARFVGAKPYGELQQYARCVDVAVLPYRKKEPTFSGSSTRFYEHLAALRPMVATRGFAELLEKEPLLQLVDTPAELAAALTALNTCNFIDGHEHERWHASQQGTWENRADTMVQALTSRLNGTAPLQPSRSPAGSSR